MVLAAVLLSQTKLRLADGSGQLMPVLGQARPTVALFVLRDCPISRKYSPEIQRLIRDYPGVSFRVVLTDPDANPAMARADAAEFSLHCPVLVDRNRIWAKASGVTTVPTAALFDKSGRLVYRGRIDDRFPALGVELAQPRRKDLRLALEALRTGKPIATDRTPVVGCALPSYF